MKPATDEQIADLERRAEMNAPDAACSEHQSAALACLALIARIRAEEEQWRLANLECDGLREIIAALKAENAKLEAALEELISAAVTMP